MAAAIAEDTITSRISDTIDRQKQGSRRRMAPTGKPGSVPEKTALTWKKALTAMRYFQRAAVHRRRTAAAIITTALEEDAGYLKRYKINLRRDIYDETNHQL